MCPGVYKTRHPVVIVLGIIFLFYCVFSLNFSDNKLKKVLIPTVTPQLIGSPQHIVTFFNKTIKPPGVLVKPTGGTGNQLFQYACAYNLARETNWPLYVYIDNGDQINSARQFKANQRLFSLDQFSIPRLNVYDHTTSLGKIVHINDEQYFDDKILQNTDNQLVQIHGYCQSPEFWVKYNQTIKTILQPAGDIITAAPESVKKVLSDILKTESVALHIRRGDYLRFGDSAFVPISYQRSAIRRMVKILMKRSITAPVFFVFSDDINFARSSLKDFENFFRFVYVSALKTSSIQDFYLMTKCKHIILPNSTFSWWAAFLNQHQNKTVIASAFNPEYWRQRNRGWVKRLHGNFYHPLSWIVINPFAGEH